MRFNNSFALLTTDNLSVGTTNRYYLTALVFALLTTDNLNVGTTNRYYLTSLKEQLKNIQALYL